MSSSATQTAPAAAQPAEKAKERSSEPAAALVQTRRGNATLAIARREMGSYFFSPIAYVVMCLFMLLVGLFFLEYTLRPSSPATMRETFGVMIYILIFVAPAISMKLLSEELRSGTIEPLMTSPVSDVQVVIGKWLGALGFFTVLLACTGALVSILYIWGNPDVGPLITGYVGLLLVGAFYLAIGTFASTITRNQIIAFMITVFIVLIFTILTGFAPQLAPPNQYEMVVKVAQYLNVNYQFEDFSKGLVDLSNFTFFLSGIALFLAMAVKILESRRWR